MESIQTNKIKYERSVNVQAEIKSLIRKFIIGQNDVMWARVHGKTPD